MRKSEEVLRGTLDRLADEWQHADALAAVKKQAEEELRQREQARTQRMEAKDRQRREIAMLIAKLEQLRRVRKKRQSAELPTHLLVLETTPSIEDDYFELVKAMSPSEGALEGTDQQATSATAMAESTAAAVAAAARDADLPDSDDDGDDIDDGGSVQLQDLDAEFNEPMFFYYNAHESLDALIAIRRQWDGFLAAPRMGSRIPSTFISPPDPPSESWVDYSISLANS